MTEALQEIFTKEYFMQLERVAISLKNRLQVDGYSGERRSMAKGSSMEFSDFREYAMGDDLRRVDWHGYGRFGKLYIKLFLEEKQAEISVFLDCSSSMEDGAKFLKAKAVAASLAYTALCAGDRVNLFLWNGDLVFEKRGIAQKSSFPQVLQALDMAPAAGETKPLRAALRSGKLGRGAAFMISDFFTENSPKEAAKILKEKRQEVFFIQMLSKEEAEPKEGSAVRLVDRETGETCDLELTAAAIAAYHKARKAQQGALAETCKEFGGAFFAFHEDVVPLHAIREILK